MHPRKTTSWGPPTFLLLTSLTLPVLSVDALAQEFTPHALVQPEDGSRFGRVRYREGVVVVQGRRGFQPSERLEVNLPILAGDHVISLEGRAEIQLPDGSLIRLDRETAVRTLALSDLANQLEQRNLLRLTAGSMFLHVQKIVSAKSVFRVQTPSATVSLLTQGIYRMDVSPDGRRTVVSSRNGVAEVVSQGVSLLVRSGERTDVFDGRAATEPRPFNAYRRDDFDRWNQSRQGAYVRQYAYLPAREVPVEVRPYVTELAYHGNWVHEPTYGWVWQPPRTREAWSPYLVGRWYRAPAGWTWVSYEPWGWAPYHYGRWQLTGDLGWIWIPGRIYSGAWVSWASTATHLGWSSLDYYNRPAPAAVGSARSWVFVARRQVRDPRVPDVAASPAQTATLLAESVPLVTRAGPGTRTELVSFRTLEGNGQVLTRPTPASGRRPIRPIPIRPVALRPGDEAAPAPRFQAVRSLPVGSEGELPAAAATAAAGFPSPPPAVAPVPTEEEEEVHVFRLEERNRLLQRIFVRRQGQRMPVPVPAGTSEGTAAKISRSEDGKEETPTKKEKDD